MPLLETKGAASAQGFGLTLGGAAPVYIEDVFSTWLYTGNGSTTQAIPNGVDLSTYGGLVWEKVRNVAGSHYWSTSGINVLSSNTTAAASGGGVTFTTNGYTLNSSYGAWAASSNLASWTFRKQPKFFDVVTYTGNGVAGRTVAHSLGSVPGCIIVKQTSGTEPWAVYHRSLGNNALIYLNYDDAQFTPNSTWNTTSPTSTEFTVGTAGVVNTNGATYVAYIFAHNAGGFGLTGTDNVISCGSFTTDGSGNATINLGYEPQWFLRKRTDDVGSWTLVDNMRGFTAGGTDAFLYPNLSNAEATSGGSERLTSTGVQITGFGASMTFIYIAIRRGPMRTPTTGTSVFNPLARTGTGTNPTVVTTTNNPDLLMSFPRTASPSAYGMCFWDKLRGISPMLQSAGTSAETNTNTTRVLQGWLNTGYQAGADFIEGYLNYSGSTYVNYPITRAPGFFDVVCYTGTGSTDNTVNHNLGVAPEMMIVRIRNNYTVGVDASGNWAVYHAALGNQARVQLNLTNAVTTGTGVWYSTTPTATTFKTSADDLVNKSASGYVAYLFASCPGVSKVGSYTGTGALQTINCGFTGGARFVLIKRTDSTGDWFTYDSARGITSGTDPYLLMNSTAAEVTGTNYVDTTSVGFQVTAAAPAGLNANGGTYIFLAIA